MEEVEEGGDGAAKSQLAAGGAKRRSCRIRVVPSGSAAASATQHRRSWSVGGSNVHQTMMKRSRSHIRRLGNIAESGSANQPDKGQSPSTASRRRSILRDAECQTERPNEQDEETVATGLTAFSRSKGDGISVDSPALTRFAPLSSNVNSSTSSSSESDPEEEELEKRYNWDRTRGRASGSSQRLSLSESTSSQIFAPSSEEPSAGPGRRFTVDMSQYKYNESWVKRVHHLPPPSARQPVGTFDKGNQVRICRS